MTDGSWGADGEIKRWARPNGFRAIVLVGMLVLISTMAVSFFKVTVQVLSAGEGASPLSFLVMFVWYLVIGALLIGSLTWVERARIDGAWVTITHGPFGLGRAKRYPIESISGIRLTELPYTRRAQTEGSYAMFGHRRALAFDCKGATCYAFSGLRASESEDVLMRFRTLVGPAGTATAASDSPAMPHVTATESVDGLNFDVRYNPPLPQRIQLVLMTPFLFYLAYLTYARGGGVGLAAMYLVLAAFTVGAVSVLTFGARSLTTGRDGVSSRLVIGGLATPIVRRIATRDLVAVEFVTGEKRMKWNGGVKDAPGVHFRGGRSDIAVGASLDEAERKALYEMVRTRSGLSAALFAVPITTPHVPQ